MSVGPEFERLPSAIPGTAGSLFNIALARKCGERAARELRSSLTSLFYKATGMKLGTVWASPLRPNEPITPLGQTPVCERLCQPTDAERCRTRYKRNSDPCVSGREITLRFFDGLCGLQMWWTPLRTDTLDFGALYFCGLTGRGLKKARRWPRRHRWHALGLWARAGKVAVPAPARLKVALRLLRMTAEDIVRAIRVELLEREVGRLSRSVGIHRRAEARLRREIRKVLPFMREKPPAVGGESCAEHLVRRMLDYLRDNYVRPLALKEFANIERRNPAYLSALFSKTIGISFRTYLTELRMERAQELLADAEQRVSQVARAVGFTSENRFRQAFKGYAGVSPTAWRIARQTRSRPEGSQRTDYS